MVIFDTVFSSEGIFDLPIGYLNYRPEMVR